MSKVELGNVDSLTTVAGILLTARQLRQELELGDCSPSEIASQLCVSRSQMYAIASRVRALIDEARSAGRPRSVPTQPSVDGLLERGLFDAVRNWLYDHPGAAYRVDERMHYSDTFRAFVVGLVAPDGAGQGVTRQTVADIIGISKHTLDHWLCARLPARKPAESEPTADERDEPVVSAPSAEVDEANDEVVEAPEGENDDTKIPVSQWAARAAQVIGLWQKWEGGFTAFCDSLPDHGINYSYSLVRTILSLSNERPQKKRRPAHPDPEAIRGELIRMFANAQWHADGKNVLVQVGDTVYRFAWELVVDNATTGHLGFSIQDHENAAGVLEALQHAELTTGEPPVGFLRDPRKCNTAEEIEQELDKKKIVSMFPTVRRPQSNSPAETEVGLFEQKMPPIYIPEGLEEKDLAQLVLWYVLFAYSAGRNQTPRRRLKRKTPAEAFAESAVTEEEKAQAREELRRLRRQVQENDAANRRRCAPALAKLLSDFFCEHGLDDPRDTYIPQIGSYGPEAVLEAMALFKAKQDAGTLPSRHHERYLLGIARNVAYRREDERTYEQLTRLRAKAGDLILEPLLEHDLELSGTLSPNAHRKAVLNLALDSTTKIDRVFWRRRFLELFQALPQTERHEEGRWCARLTACRTKLHHKERDHFIALLADAAAPLAA
ncbi:MAG: hypothetical protein HN849_19660 [Victivallales bacterium]|nr:hypothetical protein [Verrucomicrobiota bacterium]MBT7301750.1 hypothetical protein [Victivallales bacterium]